MDETSNKAGSGQKKIGTVLEAFTVSVPDRQRKEAVLYLVNYLQSGAVLLARCEDLLETQPLEQFGAMSAAARLLQANARVAEALSRIAPAEQRRRSVVLHVTDDRPTREELIREIEKENAQAGKDAVKMLEERLHRLLEREEAAKAFLQTPPTIARTPCDDRAGQGEQDQAQNNEG